MKENVCTSFKCILNSLTVLDGSRINSTDFISSKILFYRKHLKKKIYFS